jgi:hypothetical protein
MTEERKILIDKIDELIEKRRDRLLNTFPNIHTLDDGVIIKFFNNWTSCVDISDIKYRRVFNTSKPDEIILFMFLPKGVCFNYKKRDYISTITCLDGKLELKFEMNKHILDSFTKMSLSKNSFEGKALENTYILTTNVH